MQLAPWIGLTGRKGAGKDSAALCLLERGYRRVGFADPVRNALLAVDPWVIFDTGRSQRLSDFVRQMGWDAAKRHPEVRRLLQRVGTEAGRSIHGFDCWIRHAEKTAQEFGYVVFTDVRFSNEAEMIRSHGGLIVEIVRPGLPDDDTHCSEAGIDRSLINETVLNTTTLCSLHKQLLESVMLRHQISV